MATRPVSIWNRTQKIGQLLRCLVVSRTEGGYRVQTVGDEKSAFLECQEVLAARQEILARVHTFDRRGLVLRPEFTNTGQHNRAPISSIGPQPARGQAVPPLPAHAQAQDQEALGEPEMQEFAHAQPLALAEAPESQPNSHQHIEQQKLPLQHSGAHLIHPAQDSMPLRLIRYKRLFDLIPKVPTTETIVTAECGFIEEFVSYVEGGLRTTCIKASCDDKLSRFLLLCYRGRLVGCTYGRRDFPDASGLAIADALKLSLGDLNVPTASAELIDVPEELMLGMAALYVGEGLAVPRANATQVFAALAAQFQNKQLTGCIAVCAGESESIGFVYAHRGALVGYFDVTEQVLSKDTTLLRQRLAQPGTFLQASIIPTVSRSLGLSLSMLAHQLFKDCQ